jgi:GntR family transcriptional regulator
VTAVHPAPPYLPGPAAPVPKYHRVKGALLERLADAEWRAGELIPSEPELCEAFGVSRITIRKAIGDLVHEGKLYTVQGKGTFVARPKLEERFVQRAFGIFEDMERRGLQLMTRVLRQDVIPPPPEIASRLKIRRDEPVHVLERLRSVEGEQLLLSTTYIPQALCPGLIGDDLSTQSLYRLLRQRYGLKIARGERSLEAVAAEQREARLLDLALASPLLLLDTITYLADGRPLEYSRVWQPGDRARVDVEFFPTGDEE